MGTISEGVWDPSGLLPSPPAGAELLPGSDPSGTVHGAFTLFLQFKMYSFVMDSGGVPLLLLLSPCQQRE